MLSVLTLGVIFSSVRVTSPLVWWRYLYYSNYALLQCCGVYGVIPDSLPIWAQTTTTTSECGSISNKLVTTRVNEEKTSIATDFSSILESKNWHNALNNDQLSRRVKIFSYLIFLFNSIIFKFQLYILYF